MAHGKRILLIDLDDLRRKSRVNLLTSAGYTVDLRTDYIEAEQLDGERNFDLVILALYGDPDAATHYSDRLSRSDPALPILLLTDFGVYVRRGTLSPRIEAGDPAALLQNIASMLEGSTHIRELPIRLVDPGSTTSGD